MCIRDSARCHRSRCGVTRVRSLLTNDSDAFRPNCGRACSHSRIERCHLYERSLGRQTLEVRILWLLLCQAETDAWEFSKALRISPIGNSDTATGTGNATHQNLMIALSDILMNVIVGKAREAFVTEPVNN